MQIEAPSGIFGMRRALLDVVEAGKNVQLNIDGAENSGYTEENGGVSNDGNRMDRGMAEGVPERQDARGKREETWRDGRTNQVLSRRNLSQSVQNAFTESGVAAAELYEFDNGIGAGAVHEESKVISENALDFALGEGDNIVLPIVGGNYEKLVAQIEQFRARGYEVAVHLCDLPSNKAIGRAIGRYLSTGRYIPMDILYGYGNKPKENFYRLVQEGIIHEYSEYSNDVGYGEAPKQIRQSSAYAGGASSPRTSESGVVQDLGRYARGDGKGAQQSNDNSRGRKPEDASTQGEVHRPAEGQGAARRLTEPENKLAPYGAVQDGGDKGRSRVVENTLKNSPVFGGVFQDVRDEMLEQNKNAAQYNISHEVDSMAEAADRIQADPKGEAEYLLTDNDGHVWSAPDIDTAMGLIASNQLDGDAARAVEVVISFLTASAIQAWVFA